MFSPLERTYAISLGLKSKVDAIAPLYICSSASSDNCSNFFTIPYKMSAGWWFGTERYSKFFQATIEQAEFS
ncbi:MAG: hypothetical protein KME38_24380 [Spirirestis rafaelensis WJT71-NPBG6]|jgi:hypothetical protein|nr:hypothetical protein [Spirirestis rafaelensis WJT71-NPBG6]